VALQVALLGPQLMPLPFTVPWPVPARVTVRVSWAGGWSPPPPPPLQPVDEIRTATARQQSAAFLDMDDLPEGALSGAATVR